MSRSSSQVLVGHPLQERNEFIIRHYTQTAKVISDSWLDLHHDGTASKRFARHQPEDERDNLQFFVLRQSGTTALTCEEPNKQRDLLLIS